MRSRTVLYKTFAAMAFCASLGSCFGTGSNGKPPAGDAPAAGAEGTATPSASFPIRYGYKVVNTYPHSERSYTQGLYWHDGYLWEGTGQYGQSALKQVELTTGRSVREVELPARDFGEGIALLDGKIYQLTWLEGKAYVYDGATLEVLRTFEYAGQGWGITTDGRNLYMSNGSHEIHVLDPSDFSRQGTVRVSLGRRRLSQLNELEWIDGRIWANLYEQDQIAIINPEDGVVEGLVDLTGILPANMRTHRTDVLNGIAYDEATGRIFVTGKNWPTLYEIELVRQ